VVKRRPQHSDESLLHAATAVFARDGYAAATVEAIAAEAGTTKPTLYARFGSKSDLYEAAVEHEAAAIRAHLFAAYDRAANLLLADFVREAVDAWFAYAAERPDGMRLLFVGDHVGAESTTARETTDAIANRLADAVEDFTRRRGGMSAGAAAPVVGAMVVGAAVHAIRRCLADPTLDPDATAALTTNFLEGATRHLDPALFKLRR
jgi:AcrR family transcriptional regulator